MHTMEAMKADCILPHLQKMGHCINWIPMVAWDTWLWNRDDAHVHNLVVRVGTNCIRTLLLGRVHVETVQHDARRFDSSLRRVSGLSDQADIHLLDLLAFGVGDAEGEGDLLPRVETSPFRGESESGEGFAREDGFVQVRRGFQGLRCFRILCEVEKTTEIHQPFGHLNIAMGRTHVGRDVELERAQLRPEII